MNFNKYINSAAVNFNGLLKEVTHKTTEDWDIIKLVLDTSDGKLTIDNIVASKGTICFTRDSAILCLPIDASEDFSIYKLERKTEPVVEMTKEEIEKKLGYKIKIVE